MEAKIEEIEIETINRCNGSCSFCPVNVNEPQRPYARMEFSLVEKILDELVDINYTGKLSFFSNNEPFLDERIVDFYRMAKNKLPKCYTNLYTNGSLLKLSTFLEIIDYIDFFAIDNYNDDLKVNSSLNDVWEYINSHSYLKEKVTFFIRKQDEVLLSRGGQAPNKKNAVAVDEVCHLPFRQLVIRPTGEVSLCCNDALGKYTLGDLKKETIMEVWNSDQAKKIRNEMLTNRRKNLNLCNKCDIVTQPLQDKR